MIVKLSDGVEVTLKDKLKYGDRCKIRIAKGFIENSGKPAKKEKGSSDVDNGIVLEMMKVIPKNSVETELIAMECFITKVMKGNEEITEYREFIEDLDIEDVEKILEHVKPFIEKALEDKKK